MTSSFGVVLHEGEICNGTPSVNARYKVRYDGVVGGRMAGLAFVGAGCAYRTSMVHVPESIAPPGSQLQVAQVTVEDRVPDLDPAFSVEIQQYTTEILTDATKAPGHATGSASVCVHVVLQERRNIFDAMREDGIASMLLLGEPLGLVLGRERLSVDVTVETGGRTYTGHGSENKLGSMYASARRRALAVALDQGEGVRRHATPTTCGHEFLDIH